MNQKHLLRFIKKKFKSVPDEVVARRKDGTTFLATMTLTDQKPNFVACLVLVL